MACGLIRYQGSRNDRFCGSKRARHGPTRGTIGCYWCDFNIGTALGTARCLAKANAHPSYCIMLYVRPHALTDILRPIYPRWRLWWQ